MLSRVGAPALRAMDSPVLVPVVRNPLNSGRALADAQEFPAETLRLVGQRRDALRRKGDLWADFFADEVRRRIENGSFLGVLWFGPGGEPVALAHWEPAGEVGRRGQVYLGEGFQRRSVLEAFLNRLESGPTAHPPFVSWSDEIPGVSEADRDAVFAGRGFFGVVRADMRLPAGIELPHLAPLPGYDPRALSVADETRMAELLFRVYQESPERALFATTLDQREEARRGVWNVLHGEVGEWLPRASFGIERDGRLIALTLANDFEGGLIAEVGVDPSHRRQGLARRLLSLTTDALRSAGFRVPRLVVSMWNPGAVRLYRSLGFEFVPGGASRIWLNLRALGVSRPPPP